jgi:hypothetical protein
LQLEPQLVVTQEKTASSFDTPAPWAAAHALAHASSLQDAKQATRLLHSMSPTHAED